MSKTRIIKIIIDIGMIIALLLLMTYELIGADNHEYIGMAMFALFIVHHILNRKWARALFKGRYTPFRILQTALVVCVFLTMIGSMVSAIILSRHVFDFLSLGGTSWARALHMLCAYWGLIFMSLHLGLHWNMMIGMGKKIFLKSPKAGIWVTRLVGVLISGYGIYAFAERGIGEYLFMQIQYVFFDFEEPLIFFILDYLAIMGLFMFFAHYFAKGLLVMQKRKKERND